MKISVLTPSFNSGAFIERAIQSVMSQDYLDWEHIVMDGGSTDNTLEILKQYDHLITKIEKDKGQSDALNKAFQLSTGDIIVSLNADDCLEKGIFRKVVSHFKESPDSKFVYGKVRVHQNNETFITKGSSRLMDILEYDQFRFPLNALGYYYKREVQESIGAFPMDNHHSMDYWFLLRAYHKYPIDYLDVVFGNYYLSGMNKSSDKEAATASLKKDYDTFKRQIPLIHLMMQVKRWIRGRKTSL